MRRYVWYLLNDNYNTDNLKWENRIDLITFHFLLNEDWNLEKTVIKPRNTFNFKVKTLPVESHLLEEEFKKRNDSLILDLPPINPTFGTFREIFISNHAFQQWNDRVCQISEHKTLFDYLNILHLTNRIKLYRLDFEYIGIIDNDIVFVADLISGHNINIITFYGRISLIPALKYFNNLKNNYTNLAIPKELLLSQKMPIIPSKLTIIEKEGFLYQIESYDSLKTVISTKIIGYKTNATSLKYFKLAKTISNKEIDSIQSKYYYLSHKNKSWITENLNAINKQLKKQYEPLKNIFKKEKRDRIHNKVGRLKEIYGKDFSEQDENRRKRRKYKIEKRAKK